MMNQVEPNASECWLKLIRRVVSMGQDVGPRGKNTRELLHATTAFSMLDPVVRVKRRKLSYRFLGAEALWILSGSDLVSNIVPYNRHITEFSDDGIRFWGAYGPRLQDQLPYAIDAIRHDRSTRQSVMTFWRSEINRVTHRVSDVPCTVSLTFNVRAERINCHVFMRSNDLWLGWPYDMFNFTMIACEVACSLNPVPKLGNLYYTGVSAHLYESDLEKVTACLEEPELVDGQEVPDEVLYSRAIRYHDLAACRDNTSSRSWRIRPATD